MRLAHRILIRLQMAGVLLGAGAMVINTPTLHASTSTAQNKHQVTAVTTSISPLTGKTILLDAGHGGPDSGARGYRGVEEKQINLAVVMKVKQYLQEAGAIVVLTRHTDMDLASDADRQRHRRHQGDLRGRWNIIRQQHLDAVVSIHCNAAPSSAWRGAQTLYFSQNSEGKRLAQSMQESFHANLLQTNRSIQSNQTLYLLKRVTAPTVLAEIGFITNPEEAKYLKTNAYQDRVALAIYLALTKYFSQSV